MEPISTGVAIVGATTWFGNKLLGPTIDSMGNNLKNLYENGVNNITKKAIEKTENLDDGKKTNLRITKEVFESGSFSDSEITNEYFGGILASSRSIDGKDDSGIYFLDIIKSLSSGQLKLHYIIYNSIQKLIKEKDELSTVNPGLNTDVNKLKIVFSILEVDALGCAIDIDLNVLYTKGIISQYKTDTKNIEDGKAVPYFSVTPTTLGIQLFMIANNKIKDWRNFTTIDVQNFKNIGTPKMFASDIGGLIEKIKPNK